ncbi:hypothetical protein [Vibrio coralliirubri]|uniref:hypothetical protein n=1 Tax=Vibrio coralliirubri TaxID=1516159 RepID=UPI000635518A|nr:hypothetical protein [Vibrio coralliirubri]CDU01248.1 hypothetical protein VCR8J2_820042 [Vibrio coralliirubri]
MVRKIKNFLGLVKLKVNFYHHVNSLDNDIDELGDELSIREISSLEDFSNLRQCLKNLEFLDGKITNFSKNHVLYCLCLKNELIAYGWKADTGKILISEIRRYYTIPDETSLLYDFYTFEKYRSLGMYKKILKYITSQSKYRCLIYALESNIQSNKAIISCGYKFFATKTFFSKFGNI